MKKRRKFALLALCVIAIGISSSAFAKLDKKDPPPICDNFCCKYNLCL